MNLQGKGELQTYWIDVKFDEDEEDRKGEDAIKAYMSRHNTNKPTHSIKS